MKTFILIASLLPVFVQVSTAQPKIKFENKRHDFGIVEAGEKAKHEFTFTNTGDAPLIIKNVRSSCGCTTPYWSKDSIAPGDTGNVAAAYNSTNRPGNFKKYVTIYSNAPGSPHKAYIQGLVIKKQKKSPSEEELKNSPRLSLNREVLDMGKLEKGQMTTTELLIRNTGEKPLHLQNIKSSCNCITYTNAKPVAPGDSLHLKIRYRAQGKGKQEEKAIIFSNDLKNPYYSFKVRARVVKSLSPNSIMRKDKQEIPFK